MVPGGTTEIIAHFIGAMHVPEDFARQRLTYDSGPGTHVTQPWSETPAHEHAADRSLEDIPSHRFGIDYRPGDFSLGKVGMHKTAAAPLSAPHPHLVPYAPDDVAPPAPGLPSGDSSIQLTVVGTTLPPVPDQLLADVHQINVLHNNGVVLMAQSPIVLAALAALHAQDDGLLAHMTEQAQDLTPSWIPTNSATQSLIDAVASHDADRSTHPDTPPPGSVHTGVYVDGQLQPAGTVAQATLPIIPPQPAESSHNGMTNPGLDAETGSNTAINVTSIIDDHTAHSGLVVMGDSYTTDAIIQTNVLNSNAAIEIGGSSATPILSTDGNTAHNTASFGQHDDGSAVVTHFSPTANVEVDTINGNFYDVKGFEQTNALSNNDTIVQSTTSSYYQVDSGNNTQINDLPFSELNQTYDLVVVEGSFHNANYIIQQNVFLNDDAVKMLSGRGDTASQSITTGDNTLQNNAAIDHYGTTAYQPLSTDMASWITHLESGTLDPDLASQLPGNGSAQIHVLLVTGDFFDINYIAQTNIVSNADTVVQALPATGSAIAANGAATTSTQAVDTGHNQLANFASIAVVGTTSDFQFVGGSHYDDAILVQANLVTDKSHVTIGDTHALVSEVTAFTGLHDVVAAHDPVAIMPTDPGVHHDLFHGMMT